MGRAGGHERGGCVCVGGEALVEEDSLDLNLERGLGWLTIPAVRREAKFPPRDLKLAFS